MDRHVVAAGVLDAAQVQDLGARRRPSRASPRRRPRSSLRAVGHDPRVGGEDAVDVGVDLADLGPERGGQRHRGGVGAAAAERGDVLGVLADALEAGHDRDRARRRGAFSIRPGVTSMILALPCAESVITPACEPVNDRALWPRCAIAIASSAIEIRSPAVSSMSSSRGGGSGVTCSARSSSSSVVSPIAETTTTTSWPALLGGDDPLGDPLDAGRVGDRGAAVLLHDNAHRVSLLVDRGLRRVDSTGASASARPASKTASAASICDCSVGKSASSRSWATTDCSARSTALARRPTTTT